MERMMKKWSDHKLDKELAFARAALSDNDPATYVWLAYILLELARRKYVRRKA